MIIVDFSFCSKSTCANQPIDPVVLTRLKIHFLHSIFSFLSFLLSLSFFFFSNSPALFCLHSLPGVVDLRIMRDLSRELLVRGIGDCRLTETTITTTTTATTTTMVDLLPALLFGSSILGSSTSNLLPFLLLNSGGSFSKADSRRCRRHRLLRSSQGFRSGNSALPNNFANYNTRTPSGDFY